jgi:hypothetical protein
MNIKKLGLTLIVGALLLGGAGSAFGTAKRTPPPPPAPKHVELGPQTGARHTLIPAGFGTKNVVTKREYTELAVPCRLYDSRLSSPLPAGSFRTIPLTACTGIPTYATSLNVSLSAVSPAHAGYMRVWANGAPEPAQTVLRWSTFSTTTGATVAMSSSGLRVHSVGGPTNLVIEVAGYYSPAIYVDILPSSTTAFGEVYSSTDMISGAGSSKLSPGDMTISIRRNIQYCDIQATAESAGYHATAVQYSADTLLVQVRDNAGNPARAYASVSVNC